LMPGAVALNDVAVNEEGRVLVTDTGGNQIFQVADGEISLWDEEVESPNGIMDFNNRVYVSQWNPRCIRIYDKSREVDFPMSYSIPEADGFDFINQYGFIVSSWGGEVRIVDYVGNKKLILDTRNEGIQAADIFYIEELNLLLVATFDHDRIMAYSLIEEEKAITPISVDPKILSGQELVRVFSSADPERELYQNQIYRGTDISVYVVATESKMATWDSYSITEFISVLNGQARVQPQGKVSQYYKTGDMFCVPRGFQGEWETQGGSEYLMELSVIATYPRDTSENVLSDPKAVSRDLFSGIHDDSLARETIFSDKELTLEITEEKPSINRAYTQEHDELIKIIAGALTIYIGKESYEYYPGEFIILPKGLKGVWKSAGLDVLRLARVTRTK